MRYFAASAPDSAMEVVAIGARMTILTMRRWRCSDGAGRRGRAPRLFLFVTLAAMLALGNALPVEAQGVRSGVDVDLGALDTLQPPAPGDTRGSIRLHMPQQAPTPQKHAAPAPPPKRQVTASPPAGPSTASAPPRPAAPSADPPPLQKAKAPPSPNLPPPVATEVKPTAPPQTASRDPTTAPVGTIEDRVVFPADMVKLPEEAKAELNLLAKRLSADGHLYVQIVAYAGSESDASAARRLSLSRALAARSYLVEQGVEIKQLDVRPLGNRTETGLPPDRVDLVVAVR
jgi:outer membrane protein OmpA-like peptidoglycan-associated protein